MKVDNLFLEKCIGKGAFGEVFLTSKEGDTKKYATKTIQRDKVEGTKVMNYLKNEIIILQHLKHPNIVKFEDVKKSKKHFFIVLELCNGGELSKALEKYKQKFGKPFSEEIVQHLMRQIINAFQYIHNKGIIHKDINLDNILLNYETEKDKEELNLMKATVKIIDFVFACKISKYDHQNSALGNPIKIDPTILEKKHDEKEDIYSLGIICYEMLIGKPAFNTEDMEKLVSRIDKKEYFISTALSKEAISFLKDMLQYDSNSRLNSDQLSKHSFLTKNINNSHSIDS